MNLFQRIFRAEDAGYSLLQARDPAFAESPWGAVALYGTIALTAYLSYRRSRSLAEEVKARRIVTAPGVKAPWASGLTPQQIDGVRDLQKELLVKLTSPTVNEKGEVIEEPYGLTPRGLKKLIGDYRIRSLSILGDDEKLIENTADQFIGVTISRLWELQNAQPDTPEGRRTRVDLNVAANSLISEWRGRLEKKAMGIAKRAVKRPGDFGGEVEAVEYARETVNQTFARALRNMPAMLDRAKSKGRTIFEEMEEELEAGARDIRNMLGQRGFTGLSKRLMRVKTGKDLAAERGAMAGKEDIRVYTLDEISPGVFRHYPVREKNAPGKRYVVQYYDARQSGDLRAFQTQANVRYEYAVNAAKQADDLSAKGNEKNARLMRERSLLAYQEAEELAKKAEIVKQSLESQSVFPTEEMARKYIRDLSANPNFRVKEEIVVRDASTTVEFGKPELYLTFSEEKVSDPIPDRIRAARLGIGKQMSKRKRDAEKKKSEIKIKKIEDKGAEASEEELAELLDLRSKLDAIATLESGVRLETVADYVAQNAEKLSEEEKRYLQEIGEGLIDEKDPRYPKYIETTVEQNIYRATPEEVEEYERTGKVPLSVLVDMESFEKLDPKKRKAYIDNYRLNGTLGPEVVRRPAVMRLREPTPEQEVEYKEKGIPAPSVQRVFRVGRTEIPLESESTKWTTERAFQLDPTAIINRGGEVVDLENAVAVSEVMRGDEEIGSRLLASNFAEGVIDKIDAEVATIKRPEIAAEKKYPDLIRMFRDENDQIDYEGINSLMSGEYDILKKGARNAARDRMIAARAVELRKTGMGENRARENARKFIDKKIHDQLDLLRSELNRQSPRGRAAVVAITQELEANALALAQKTYSQETDDWVAENLTNGRRLGAEIFRNEDVLKKVYGRVQRHMKALEDVLEKEGIGVEDRDRADQLYREISAYRAALDRYIDPDPNDIRRAKNLMMEAHLLRNVIVNSKLPENHPRIVDWKSQLETADRLLENVVENNPPDVGDLAKKQFEIELRDTLRTQADHALKSALAEWHGLYQEDLESQGLKTPVNLYKDLQRLREEALALRSRKSIELYLEELEREGYERPEEARRFLTNKQLAGAKLAFTKPLGRGDKTPQDFLDELEGDFDPENPKTYIQRADKRLRDELRMLVDAGDPNAVALAEEYDLDAPLGIKIFEDDTLRQLLFENAKDDWKEYRSKLDEVEDPNELEAVEKDLFEVSQLRKALEYAEGAVDVEELDANKMSFMLEEAAKPDDLMDLDAIGKVEPLLEVDDLYTRYLEVDENVERLQKQLEEISSETPDDEVQRSFQIASISNLERAIEKELAMKEVIEGLADGDPYPGMEAYVVDLHKRLSNRGPAGTKGALKGVDPSFRLGNQLLLQRQERNRAFVEARKDAIQLTELEELVQREMIHDPDKVEELRPALEELGKLKDQANLVAQAIEEQDYLDLLQAYEEKAEKDKTAAKRRAVKHPRFYVGPKELFERYQESVKNVESAREKLSTLPQTVDFSAQRERLREVIRDEPQVQRIIVNIASGKDLDPKSVLYLPLLMTNIPDAQRKPGEGQDRHLKRLSEYLAPTIDISKGRSPIAVDEFRKAYRMRVFKTPVSVDYDDTLANLTSTRYQQGVQGLKSMFDALKAKIELDLEKRGKFEQAYRIPAMQAKDILEKMTPYRAPSAVRPETIAAQKRFIELTKRFKDAPLPLVQRVLRRLDKNEIVPNEGFFDPYALTESSESVYQDALNAEKQIEAISKALSTENEDVKAIASKLVLDPTVTGFSDEILEKAKEEIIRSYEELYRTDRKYNAAKMVYDKIVAEIEEKQIPRSITKKYGKGALKRLSPAEPKRRGDFWLIRDDREEMKTVARREYENAAKNVSKLVTDPAMRARLLELYRDYVRATDGESKQIALSVFEEELERTLPKSSYARYRIVTTPFGAEIRDVTSGDTNVLREAAKNLALERAGVRVDGFEAAMKQADELAALKRREEEKKLALSMKKRESMIVRVTKQPEEKKPKPAFFGKRKKKGT